MAESMINNLKNHPQTLVHYSLVMSQPETHLFDITLRLVNYPAPILDLKMPVWTPGSYLVREYARNLQDFTASSGAVALPWQKTE